MCTVNINVDEAMMQRINPGLTSRESIGQWLQHQVDLMMQEMAYARAESRKQALEKDLTPEQLYSLIAEEIDQLEAKSSTPPPCQYTDEEVVQRVLQATAEAENGVGCLSLDEFEALVETW